MYKILFLSFIFNFVNSDINNRIVNGFQNGNAQELSNLFNSQVDLTFPNTTGMYSKDQAKAVLETFFKTNKPNKATLSHETKGASSTVLTIDLNTTSGNFRINATLISVGANTFISEIKIR